MQAYSGRTATWLSTYCTNLYYSNQYTYFVAKFVFAHLMTFSKGASMHKEHEGCMDNEKYTQYYHGLCTLNKIFDWK